MSARHRAHPTALADIYAVPLDFSRLKVSCSLDYTFFFLLRTASFMRLRI